MRYEYIEEPGALSDVLERIRGADLLGVDTEAAGYHRYLDRISLVQVSTRDENFLIDPLVVDLSTFGTVFTDGTVEKIFHDSDFDLRILYRDLRLEVRGLFDTQVAAAFCGERALGLGAVVEKYLGLTLPKAYQRADWAERPLTEGMKEYAATDTAHLPDLRDRLLAELERLGRLPWAEEEFRRRESTRWDESEDAGDAFLRIKGARDLTPRGLAILRELYHWREEVARERDQATFRVLVNQAMIEMSLRAPKAIPELREIAGVSAGLADRRGKEMLAAIRRGLEVPESELPRFPPTKRWDRDPEVEERADRLRVARTSAAERLNLDPGFLMSRAVLDEIARRRPTSPEDLALIPEIRQWQIESIGADLLRAIK
jgi:ribonuclease D